MARLHRQPVCVASALLVPFLSLGAPAWLTIGGIGPAWSVLWLLPWALVDGPVSGSIAGVAIGLVLDGLTLDGASQVPALLLMGWWWGRLGRRAPAIQRTFNLGLLAWLGSAALGISLILQLLIRFGGVLDPSLRMFCWQTLWSQALITAVLAPMLVSIQLLIWRRRSPA